MADQFGTGGNDNLVGTAAPDRLWGLDGDDVLDGLEDADLLVGGPGDDVYYVDHAGDNVKETSAADGNDTVYSSVSFSLGGRYIETLVLTGTGAVAGTGNGLANVIVGNDAANVLDGAGGADVLQGGDGDDFYHVDDGGDAVVENDGEGDDVVRSAVSFSLAGQYVESLVLSGGLAIDGTGNSLANTITGNIAANLIDGGENADTMSGGGGGDTYFVDHEGDVVVETLNNGNDTVRSSVGFSLAGQHVENLVLTGAEAINGIGNSLANVITGNGAANILNGQEGNDTLDGGGGADTLKGGTGNDVYVMDGTEDEIVERTDAGLDTVRASISFSLAGVYNVENLVLTGTAADGTGNALANTIVGNAADNRLDGGAGIDRLEGGGGHDTYIVDETDDVVVDNDGDQANDEVRSSATYTLPNGVRTLVLTGTAPINGTGNASDNVLIGNSAENVLIGGLGFNTFYGGAGDDTYWVSIGGGQVFEADGEGNDTVRTAVTFSLAGQYIENLEMLGIANLDATGNSLDNFMTGNVGRNTLNGGEGNDTLNGGEDNRRDTLIGGRGDDTYVVKQTTYDPNDTQGLVNDVVLESKNEGTDTVYSNVTFRLAGQYIENLVLTGTLHVDAGGNSLDNVIIGNSGNNDISGYEGADQIHGGGGSDRVVGGIGADDFYFDTALTASYDDILDFTPADDTIMLDRTIFTEIGADGTLDASAFVAGTAAADGDDRIVYDSATGNIYYDADGNGAGAAMLFAHVVAGTALTHLDFSAYTPPA